MATSDNSSPPPSTMSTTATSMTTQMTAQLFCFATTSPSAFKEAAGKLAAGTRELLEYSIRRAMAGGGDGGTGQVVKPQISLRSY